MQLFSVSLIPLFIAITKKVLASGKLRYLYAYSSLLWVLLSVFSFLYATFAMYAYFFTEMTLPGWSSIIISILFIGGVQIIMMGILGVYIGRLSTQSKHRPNYIVKEKG